MKAISGKLVPAAVTAAQVSATKVLKTPWLAVAALFIAMHAGPADAATSASQAPLYTGTPGAKPNVMFVLDNSGSMSAWFQDGYKVSDDCPRTGTNCSGKYGWYAMRSSSVNTQYYNPAITYKARVDPDGTAQSNPLAFIDNQPTDETRPNQWIPSHSVYQKNQAVPAGSRFSYVHCKPESVPGTAPCTTPANRKLVEIGFSLGSTQIDLPVPNNRTDP